MDYDQTANYWRERKEAARETEVTERQWSLDDAHRQSVEEGRCNPPPATVEVYRVVSGDWPAGSSSNQFVAA